MKVSYKMAHEIKDIARYIDENLRYGILVAYNNNKDEHSQCYYKYDGNENKFIDGLIKRMNILKEKYNWSQRRAMNFFKLVYYQWYHIDFFGHMCGDYAPPESNEERKIDLLKPEDFDTWRQLLIYLQNDCVLQYWPTKDLMNKKI